MVVSLKLFKNLSQTNSLIKKILLITLRTPFYTNILSSFLLTALSILIMFVNNIFEILHFRLSEVEITEYEEILVFENET